MIRKTDVLRNVRVAAPCSRSWEAMDGDDKVRHCGDCKLNVYNLSGMDRDEAERLVREKEGRLCVRYYQRRDGTVITRDCPVGLRAIRKRIAVALVTTVALFLCLAASAARIGRMEPDSDSSENGLAGWKSRAREIEPIKSILNYISPPQRAVMGHRVMM